MNKPCGRNVATKEYNRSSLPLLQGQVSRLIHDRFWEWGYDVQDPHSSPVFDGSPYSMGSDGAFIPNRPEYFIRPPPPIVAPGPGLEFPLGTGGGCVFSGPFANLTVHMGPIWQPNVTEEAHYFDYNPRCLTRDLNSYFAQHFTAFNWTTSLILESPDIATFEGILQGITAVSSKYGIIALGVHGGGHFTVGGQSRSLWSGGCSISEDIITDEKSFLSDGLLCQSW